MIQILDTSIVVKWFVDEDPESTQKALGILDHVKREPGLFAVPELLYSECLHVFGKVFDEAEEINWAMDRLFRLGIRPLRFDATVAKFAVPALAWGLSGYDATFFAFAKAVQGVWLTFDAKASERVPEKKHVALL